MPIKGLSDQRRLPRLGKIRLGIKKPGRKSGTLYPAAVDYFVCPPEVQEIYGEKPTKLDILIPVEDEEKWCSQYYRCYSATRGLVCKGDGEYAMAVVNVETGELVYGSDDENAQTTMREITCRGKDCDHYQSNHCKELMQLQFLLPDVPGLGVWQIDTSSVYGILNINNAAELIRGLHGRVSMIPLELTLEMQTIRAQGKQRNQPILNLRAKGTLKQMFSHAQDYLRLTAGDLELEEPDMDDDEVDDLLLAENQAPEGDEPEPEFDSRVETKGGKPKVSPPRSIHDKEPVEEESSDAAWEALDQEDEEEVEEGPPISEADFCGGCGELLSQCTCRSVGDDFKEFYMVAQKITSKRSTDAIWRLLEVKDATAWKKTGNSLDNALDRLAQLYNVKDWRVL